MKRLKYYREQKGFSQTDIAERIGISQQAVAKWESGEAMPRADKLPILAKLLNCTTDELLEELPAPANK